MGYEHEPDYSKPAKLPRHAENGLCPMTEGKCERDCAPFDCQKWDEPTGGNQGAMEPAKAPSASEAP